MKAWTSSVIVDTNALIYSIKNRIDIEAILLRKFRIGSILVPDCVFRELAGLSSSIPFARGALRLAERFQRTASEGAGDPCILKLALDTGFPVLTNDLAFLSLLKKNGAGCLTIKNNRDIVSW